VAESQGVSIRSQSFWFRSSSHEFLGATIMLWRLILTFTCRCRKIEANPLRCNRCMEAYQRARSFYGRRLQYPNSPLVAALLLNYFTVMRLMRGFGGPLLGKPKHHKKQRSWIADYTSAILSYYEVLWSSAHQAPSVDDASKVAEALHRLCGPASEEYRRSHWHLTSA
jgi:hypothetical protein